MYVVRPVCSPDLDQIVSLVELTSYGLTTLPQDPVRLRQRIAESELSFANIEQGTPKGQAYLLVMEHVESGAVVGTSGAVSKVGGFEPFYAYRIETSVHTSETLNIRKEIPVLHLTTEHNGPAEIGSLFLHPDHRHAGNGRLLSLSRFLMMAEFPRLFEQNVIAEMRGVVDEHGRSPFWDALGRHFFELEFPKADYLSLVNKQFIGDLMPVHPIYIPLLPLSAQRVIGEVHEHTRPARRLLETEGFRFEQMIDIFEAGPILSCPREAIRSVRENCATVVSRIVDRIDSDQWWLVSSRSADFRVVNCQLEISESGVHIDRAAAEALRVSAGDGLRYVAPKAIAKST